MKVRGKVENADRPGELMTVEFEVPDDSPEAKAITAGMSFSFAPAPVTEKPARHPGYMCPNLYGCALCGPEVSE